MTPQALKDEIVIAARRKAVFYFPEYADPEHATNGCLYFTFFLIMEARRRALDMVPQAGSMFWRRMTEDQDDGISPTFFGYQWSPNDILSQISASLDQLPEMHIWGALPDSQEIIDLQTGGLPLACKSIIGMDWLAPAPPDYLWTPVSELGEKSRYEPNQEATILAWNHMTNFVQKKVREHGRLGRSI